MSTATFSTLVCHQLVHLQGFAYSLVRNDVDAKDLCQETVLKALQNQSKFKQGTNIKAWLCTIMRNTFINNYNRSKRFVMHDFSGDSFLRNISTTFNKGIDQLFYKELNGALYTLPVHQRKAIQLYNEGYKYVEIATTLSLPLGTIKSSIYQARKALASQLK